MSGASALTILTPSIQYRFNRVAGPADYAVRESPGEEKLGSSGIVPIFRAMNSVSIPDQIIEALGDSKVSVVVSTGAGVSAESGVPTFRSAGGFWKEARAETLATPEAFLDDPSLVWEWYESRRAKIAEIEPNPGHFEIARWEKHYEQFTLITQNVDGLHRLAGSSQPIELHGNIMLSKCHGCGAMAGEAGLGPGGEIPKCECGGLIRPNVVWFGELLPEAALQKAWDACSRGRVFLSVGTSGAVQPAASLANVARQAGAFLIEINPEETEISYIFDAVVRHPSGIALPVIGRLLGIDVE